MKLGQQLLDRRQSGGVVILGPGLEMIMLVWKFTCDMLEARNVPNWTKVS